jgi:hypothetical protein
MVFAQDSFLIDVINQILSQGNYCFFLDAPTDHDLSIGVPVFRPQSATSPPREGMVTIRDTQLLEALAPTWDLSNLPYVMRFRGAVSPAGKALFADLTLRVMGTYWPPWSGHDTSNLQGRDFKGGYPLGRVAGVRRQFSETDETLSTVTDCLFACILAAIQYALQAVTANVQAPCLPGVSLDDQIAVRDEGTGTSTRLWVASIESDHTLGPDGAWHMTIGSSVLDTEDMQLISEDYRYTYARYVLGRTGS